MPKSRVPADLTGIASRLADREDLWSPLIKFDPLSRYYVRLASEPTYEAWLLTWVPGQGTDWHDHGGSAGAFTVVRGELIEQAAAITGDVVRVLPEPRRLVAGSLRSFGRRHIHRVTNADLGPAVSLHVYSPALVEMNAYVRDGDQLTFAGASLVGVNW